MNCDRFDLWLDEGRPSEDRAEATAHVETCRQCAEALEAARDLELVLGARFATAPRSFTENVLARLPAREPTSATVAIFDLEPALPVNDHSSEARGSDTDGRTEET